MLEPIPFAGYVEIDQPVAWMNVHDNYKILFDDELPNAYPNAWIPLYAHPVDKAQNK
jgi:hypothetical protein